MTVNPIETELPAALRQWRAAKQLSQAEAAEELHVYLDTYRRWEQGRQIPNEQAWTVLWQHLLAVEVKP